MKTLWTTLVVFSCCLTLGTGCIVEEAPRRGGSPVSAPTADEGEGGEGAGGDDIMEGACDPGEIRDCKIQINENNCFVGEQVCEDDEMWGDCLEPGDVNNG